MANFTTHIAVGTVVSGAVATLTLAANVISSESLVAVTLAGIVGSVLPDIDLKDSRPSRALFAGLGLFFAFCALFAVAATYSIAEMWCIWLATLLFVRYAVHALFHRFSRHRGVWHSVLAGVCCWLLTAIVFHRLLDFHEGVAWLAGGFLFIGYLTHLVLDELYSVDVMDRRVKASFGSALKLYDGKRWDDTTVIALVLVAAFLAAPPSKPFVNGITSPTLWTGLRQRLLPSGGWFAGLIDPQRASTGRAPSTMTTGSIGPRQSAPQPMLPARRQRPPAADQ